MKFEFIGGYSEVGKNMTLVSIGDESVVLDMGLYLPAVVNHLEGNINKMSRDELIKLGAIPDDNSIDKKSVNGIVFGHAHLDHIGAAPYLAKKYRCDFFGTAYTLGILKTLFDDKKLRLRNRFIEIKFDSKYRLCGNFSIEFRHMTHSIMDAAMTVIHTSEGKIAYSNDYKIDYKPVLVSAFDNNLFSELAPVKVLVLDSLYGDVQNKTCLIVDDMIDTGGTLVQAAQALTEKGAVKVYACCTHGVFAGNAIEKISNSTLEQVVTTNSIPLSPEGEKCGKIKVLSIGKLLAEAIRSIHDETSVSKLFI